MSTKHSPGRFRSVVHDTTAKRVPRARAIPALRTALAKVASVLKRDRKTSPTRERGRLGLLKDTFLMALGQDDEEDYECNRG